MNKIVTIQKLVDKAITFEQAREILQCSSRTIRRHIATLKDEGPSGFIHGLQGKISNNRNKKWEGLEKYARKQCYRGFGPTLLSEKLSEFLGYDVPVESLRRRMIERGLRTPKKSRQVRRRPRERRKGYGIMVQFDGSYHDWLENGEERCLLLAVDDATGTPIHAKFTKNESINDVLGFREEYFSLHGKPDSIYLDCHASYKVNHRKDQFDHRTITRFQAGMNRLGVCVIFSKSPQGKGRVENKFRLFQDRGIKEMRLAGVSNYEEAEKYLQSVLLKQFKEKFSIKAKVGGDFHVPLTEEENSRLQRIFARRTKRKLNNVGVVQYLGKKYLINKGQLLDGTRNITVLESHYGNLEIYNGTNQLYFDLLK